MHILPHRWEKQVHSAIETILLIPNTLNNIAVRLLFSILESPILRINNIVPYCEGHGTLFPLDNLQDTFNMLYLT